MRQKSEKDTGARYTKELKREKIERSRQKSKTDRRASHTEG